MDSHMMTIPIMVEVCLMQSYRCEPELLEIIIYTIGYDAPKNVKKWIGESVVKSFVRTREEEQDMDSQCLRTFEFEVEVWYRDIGGVPKATKADCHTVCPQFIAAWVEQAAMKQFNRQKEDLCGHVITSNQKNG